MKQRIFKRTSFYTLVTFLVFVLVASNGITHRGLSTNIRGLEECLINRRLNKPCVNETEIRVPTPVPTLNPTIIPTPQTDKQKFLAAVTQNLPTLPQPQTLEYILLRAYGAVYVNQDLLVKLPTSVVFKNAEETKDFQTTLTMVQVAGTRNCYLQKSAADALNQARSLTRIPLKSGYGQSDCTRSFAMTQRFWNKYTNSKTLDLVRQGKETRILGTVAPPGASQHLWGLAVDLRVSNQSQVAALNQNGWYRTVEYDVPHWTYVGYSSEKLPQLGFEKKVIDGTTYWITPL